MVALSLLELFTLIATGTSVVVAAVAVGLTVVYFRLAKRLSLKTEAAVDGIENSANQMYAALTQLSQRSESSAAEIEGRLLQLRKVVDQIGREAQLLNNAAAQAIEQPPYQCFFDPQSSLDMDPSFEDLSLQTKISAIVESGPGDEEKAA